MTSYTLPLLLALSVCLCHTASAWAYNNRDAAEESDGKYSKRLMNLLQDVKRTNWLEAICGQWDDWCIPDQNKPGTTCCQGYTCKCNLWNTNCRCKSKLFGR